jgi:hypothetical protein
MKHSLFALVALSVVASASALAGLPNPVAQPSGKLACKVTGCADVQKPVNAGSWCASASQNFSDVQLSELASKAGPLWTFSDGESSGSARGQLSSENGQTRLDFNDGDQFTYLVFSSSDLQDLDLGVQKVIKGTLTDGYDWADGDHERYKLSLECTK